ncbi:hypothetical protein, partial [Janthinobacterium sp. HH100]|uniref:hypothetical protein n=1 Tax=Janthinobacterium sp. HH100 TaxID=1537272 RepID=UPI001C2FCE47
GQGDDQLQERCGTGQAPGSNWCTASTWCWPPRCERVVGVLLQGPGGPMNSCLKKVGNVIVARKL